MRRAARRGGTSCLEKAQGKCSQPITALGVAQEHPLQQAHGSGSFPGRITLSLALDYSRQGFSRALPKSIEHRCLVNARDGTEGGTFFSDSGFPYDILAPVMLQRDGGTSPLLRTVMNQAVFADVKKPAAGSAVPIVGQTLEKVPLKHVQMGEREKPTS